MAASVGATPALAVSLIDKQFEYDKQSRSNPFVLSTYKATYFMPIAYNFSPNDEPFSEDGTELENAEVKFQISVKVPLARGLFFGEGNFEVGYTQQSYWQLYKSHSTPFRETNYEPEPMITFDMNRELGYVRMRRARFSFDHQSNGRSGDLSRSWNRLCGEALFEVGDFYLSVRPWWRIPERPQDDDNPDITKYMGYGELNGIYQLGDYQFGFLLRNNLSGANKGALQLDFIYPLYAKISGYLQYFDGYGESLIDYDHHNRRLSFGIMLANWL